MVMPGLDPALIVVALHLAAALTLAAGVDLAATAAGGTGFCGLAFTAHGFPAFAGGGGGCFFVAFALLGTSAGVGFFPIFV